MPPEREAHLGEVIGTIMPPMQAVRRVHHKHPRWIEDGSNLVIAITATAVFGPIGALALYIAFMFAGKPPLQ